MPVLVEAPRRLNLPFGLLSQVPVFDLPDHGGVGIQFEELSCAGGFPAAGSCFVTGAADVVSLPKVAGGIAITPGIAVGLGAAIGCAPLGLSFDAARGYALESLALNGGRVLEQVVWSRLTAEGGELLGSLGAPSSDCWDLAGVSDEAIRQAVAAAVCYLASTGGLLGTLLMPIGLAERAIAARALEVRGGSLITRSGVPVVAGVGFGGDGVGIWVTGPLAAFLGDARVPADEAGSLDKRSNLEFVLAEQISAVALPSCPAPAYVSVSSGAVVGSAVVGSAVVG